MVVEKRRLGAGGCSTRATDRRLLSVMRHTACKTGQVIAESRYILGGTGILLDDTVMCRTADLEALSACEVTTASGPPGVRARLIGRRAVRW
jgi:hypothetical protein